MMGYKARRVPHMDNLCIPGGYFWGRTSENSVKAKFAEFYFLKVQRTRKKSQDLKPRLFHGCSLDWPGLSRKRYRTLQEEMPDSPGRNAGLSRKKCRTLQEEMPDSPGRNAGLSRKYVLEFFLQTIGFCERRSCAPVVILLLLTNRGLNIA